VLKAMLALPAIALGQGRGPISVDLSATGPGGQPADFTFWHNGEGEAGQWTIIADPTAANGRAVAQLSHDPPITAFRSRSTNRSQVRTSKLPYVSNPLRGRSMKPAA
jgi:hypothetical protein